MKRTLRYGLAILWALLIWRLTTSSQIVVTENSWLQNILMMVAHFSFFGVQAILLYFATTSKHISIGLTSMYGALIEFRQLSVPGRSADPLDWILDTLGAITFLLVLKKLQSKI